MSSSADSVLERLIRRFRLSNQTAAWQASTEALGRYKLRTGLSVLGVVIGVAAVIAMLSVSEGARAETLRQVERLGLDNIVVRDRRLTQAENEARRFHGLRAGDGEALRQLVPGTARSSPLVQRYLAAIGPRRSTQTLTLGVTADYGPLLGLRPLHGRLLRALDDSAGRRVCVLGNGLGRELFGFREPVGKQVRLGNEWYQVVGVLAPRGADRDATGPLAARDLDRATLVGQAINVDPYLKVDELWFQVADGDRVVDAGRVIDQTLRRRHRGTRNFELVVPRELLAQRLEVQRTFNVVVGSVAVLSLLVGGIGIMNIMLVSVLERTHEIGIRRAAGATRRHITVQFLTESLMMTAGGGGAGIVIGALGAWGITAYADRLHGRAGVRHLPGAACGTAGPDRCGALRVTHDTALRASPMPLVQDRHGTARHD